MPQEISYHYATAADIPGFLALFGRVIPSLSEYYNDWAISTEMSRITAEYVAAQISANPKALLLARCGEEYAGFSLNRDDDGPIWVDWYGVNPDFRRQGIGDGLIDFLYRDHSPPSSATKLICDTRINNTPSITLLEKQGFRKLCELTNHFYGQDFFLWEKMLPGR